MKSFIKILCSLFIVFGVFILVGTVSASTTNALQPAEDITYNENITITSDYSIRAQGPGYFEGGLHIDSVTFFNGTAVNNTTSDTGGDNPFTVGDNMRVDGVIWRMEEGGDNAIKIADTIIPEETDIYDLGSPAFNFQDAYFSGTVSAYPSSSDDYAFIANTGSDSTREFYVTGDGTIRGRNLLLYQGASSLEITDSELTADTIGINVTGDDITIDGGSLFVTDGSIQGSSVTTDTINNGNSATAITMDSIINIPPSSGTPYACGSGHYGDIIYNGGSANGNCGAERFCGCRAGGWQTL